MSEDEAESVSPYVLTRNKARQSYTMLGPKVEPAAVKIVVFSTDVSFLTCDGSDFEMYIVGGNKFLPLPCLSICYYYCFESGVGRYTLHDSSKGCAKIGARAVREGARTRTWAFSIVAFSLVNGRLLVVQTDFGLLFCLDLVESEWRFWDGPILPGRRQNLMTENGLVLCPSGASLYGGPGITVPFPLSSHLSPLSLVGFYGKNSLISLEQFEFPHYLLGILQVSNYGDGGSVSTVDLVNVNASKFNSDRNVDEDKDKDEKFVKLVKRFRFEMIVWDGPATPEALFLF